MDLIYRKDQYNNIRKKLLQLRGEIDNSPEGNATPSEHMMISKGIDTILTHLHNQKEYVHYRLIYGMLIIPLAVVLLISLVRGDYLLPGVYLLGVAVYLYLAHIRMEQVINDNRELADYDSDDTTAFLRNKINYISSALDIKASRAQLLMIAWCVFFAPLMAYAYRVIMGAHAFGSLWISLGVAYLLAIPFWYYYFFQSLREYAEIDYQLGLYREHLEKV